MKSIYRVIRVIAVLLLMSAAAVPLLTPAPVAAVDTWVQMASGVETQLNQVFFVTEDLGYVTGELGVLLKTTDGGDNWQNIAPAGMEAAGFNGVFFTDADNGWVTGDVVDEVGKIFKTTDGGDNWTDVSLGSNANEPRNIWTSDGTNIWIVGNNATILKSTDGGDSWTDQSATVAALTSSYIFDIQFEGDIGYVATKGGQILKTTNGGTSWTEQTTGLPTNQAVLNIEMVDTSKVWNCGSVKGGQGHIMYTDNGGADWGLQSHPLAGAVYEIRAIDASKAYGAGQGMVYTENGGGSWASVTIPTSEKLRGLYMVSETVGYAVGDAGTIIKLSDVLPAPTADFSTVGGTAFTVGDEIIFSNESQNTGDAPTYLWNFGDGTTSDDDVGIHTYTTAGLYDVSLTVTNETGPDTMTKEDFLYIVPAGKVAMDPDEAPTISNADGSLKMYFPEASTAKRCAVTFTALEEEGLPAPIGIPHGDTFFSIDIVDEDGAAVTECIDNPETETINERFNIIAEYSEEDLAAAGGTASRLSLAYYNETTSKWEVMDSMVNVAIGAVSAQSTHASTWAVVAGSGGGCCAGAAATAADIASGFGLVGMLGLAATYFHIRKRR